MQRWAGYFARKGYEVHVVTPYAGWIGNPYGLDTSKELDFTAEAIQNVKLHKYLKIKTGIGPLDFMLAAAFLPWKVWCLKNLFNSIKPDIVHSHYINDFTFAAALTGFSPLVITAWGSDVLFGPSQSGILRALFRFIFKKSHLITCDAEHIKNALIKLGAADLKIHRINFGTDTNDFHPSLYNSTTRKKLGLAGHTVVVSLRNLLPVYDVESLINAIPLVLKDVSKVKFIILGSGSEEDHLKGLTSSLGVTQAVHFMGKVDQNSLRPILGSADIYVSTALSDAGIAASTAEAMACGLPVVVTKVGDNHEWVTDGISGFIVGLRDHAALASHIIHLAKHPNERKLLGNNAREIIVERNNWSKEMAKMDELYQSAIHI